MGLMEYNGLCVALISVILNILCAEFLYGFCSLPISFVHTVLTI